ncbi:MAG: undecaprenyl-diphosphate phosphatase [Bacteroidetes bacterium]|nr:undecaprenyl-diphosphate phosphatase [Bacteroidota bacterium]MBS1930969.1 undecaprenyl-diphosphate phosphatase [Bacteroidota bacterium]
MSLFEAIVLGIVEGLTEFLPISSTGHMIIASSILGIQHDEFTKMFEISIQFGAILAVVILYARKFFQFNRWQFYAKLIVGVIPALILGYLFSDKIDAMLESPMTVAITMLAGGIILLFVDKLFKHPVIDTDEKIHYRNSFIVGCWQVLAMIPGVSRSAASIIGGMQQKFTRFVAAEFSFFLAVPTMFAATFYSVFMKKWGQDGAAKKGYELILADSHSTTAFLVGNAVAFIVAILAIRFFIGYLKKRGFRVFGVYRILAGILLLTLLLSGVIKG